MAVIPDDLKDSHRQDIQKYLEAALAELGSQGAQRVTSRLNYSNTNTPAPVWAGTVEAKSIRDLRRFDAGEVRFGQSNRSKVYEDALNKGGIIRRDWGNELPEKSQAGYGPGQALGPRAGCRYQLFIALRTNEGRRFGTLTVGFKQEPTDMKEVERIMGDWATEKKPYVPYLKKNFDLGGPS